MTKKSFLCSKEHQASDFWGGLFGLPQTPLMTKNEFKTCVRAIWPIALLCQVSKCILFSTI